MILDERCEFADATVLPTTAPATSNIGDQIPLTVARNIGAAGASRPLFLEISVQAAVTGGASTVQFLLVSDSGVPLTDGSATVHFASKAIPVAQLTAGAVVAVVPLPGEPPAYEAVLGVQVVVGGAALTAGSVNAFLTPVPKQWKAYADAIN